MKEKELREETVYNLNRPDRPQGANIDCYYLDGKEISFEQYMHWVLRFQKLGKRLKKTYDQKTLPSKQVSTVIWSIE